MMKNNATYKEGSFSAVLRDAYQEVKEAITKPVTYAWTMGFAVSPALAKAAETSHHASSDINAEIGMMAYTAVILGIGIFFGRVMKHIDGEEKREYNEEVRTSQNDHHTPTGK